MAFVKKEDILHASKGGLDIILKYYPQANDVLVHKKKNFKIRHTEKTASATIKQLEDGIWVVTDFGGDQIPKNAIAICMEEDNLSFKEACDKLGGLLGLTGEKIQDGPKAKISKRALKTNEEPGKWYFEFKDGFTPEELAVLGPRINEEHLNTYKLKAVKQMTRCKDNEAVVWESTPEYPIFCFDMGEWQKILQPKSANKKYRFMYAGKKPKNHIFGLGFLKKEYQKYRALHEKTEIEGEKKEDEKPYKLPKVIIGSGDRDSLNIFSMADGGHNIAKSHYVIWLNSETDTLSYEDYRRLSTWCNNIYNIPDLDKTGIKAGARLGLRHLDIKTIWLPKELAEKRDWRGNPRKDFRDFIELYYDASKPRKFINRFNKLIETALPMRFWDVWASDNGMKYKFNNTQAYHFLKHSGFGRIKDENTDEYVFIQKVDNIVRKVKPVDIENYVHLFLEKRQMPIALRNMVYTTGQLKEASLNKLPVLDIDFKDSDSDRQFFFCKNKTWEISKKGIIEHKLGDYDKYTWEDKIIDHRVKAEDPYFEITKDQQNNYDIKVLEKDCDYFNFLINGSRIHWRKDLEEAFDNNIDRLVAKEYAIKNKFEIAGSNLSEDEKYEQKLHLINKIYAIGYLLHKHKAPNKAWAVYAMDNKISEGSESHGGSGKSLSLSSLKNVLKNFKTIKGRDVRVTQNDFIYDGVTKFTDAILVDDANQYLNYDFFFSEITGSMNVNPKTKTPYELDFSDSPKFIFSSNFPPRNLDPSTARRLLFVVFSDYYHFNKEDEYLQVRQVSDDFEGKNLFDSWNENQWNKYFNFLAQCLSFFLSNEGKFDPPMGNVKIRNLRAEMGAKFFDWALNFFFQKNDTGTEYLNLNTDLSKRDTEKDFENETGIKNLTPQNFKKKLKSFCQLHGWTFSDKEREDKHHRIMARFNGKSQEILFIKAEEQITIDQTIEQPEGSPLKPKDETDWFDEIK